MKLAPLRLSSYPRVVRGLSSADRASVLFWKVRVAAGPRLPPVSKQVEELVHSTDLSWLHIWERRYLKEKGKDIGYTRIWARELGAYRERKWWSRLRTLEDTREALNSLEWNAVREASARESAERAERTAQLERKWAEESARLDREWAEEKAKILQDIAEREANSVEGKAAILKTLVEWEAQNLSFLANNREAREKVEDLKNYCVTK